MDDPFGTTDDWIDLWTSDDGAFLYQLFALSGTIDIFEIGNNNYPNALTLAQEASDLLIVNIQGTIAF